MRIVALIPARAGSKRIPGKNTRLLHGHPIIAYTIAAAQQSGVFSRVCVCSDDHQARVIAASMDAFVRGRHPVPDGQPDIAWVREALMAFSPTPDAFAILRPTSPFRTADTIRRASRRFSELGDRCHSLRAVEPAKQSPFKMWYADDRGPMIPFAPRETDGIPWHSRPTQTLPQVYVQNSSLEMAWTTTVERYGSIAGEYVYPFFTEGLEGFSLDYPGDIEQAEALVAQHGPGILPPLDVAPVSGEAGPFLASDFPGAVAI